MWKGCGTAVMRFGSGDGRMREREKMCIRDSIRRYLADAIPKGKALDYTLPSVPGMLYINQLFHLEDVIRSKYSSFDAIKKVRPVSYTHLDVYKRQQLIWIIEVYITILKTAVLWQIVRQLWKSKMI